jgi:outer membrane protein
MMNKYLITMNILLLLGLGYCIFKVMNIPKVRYVKSAELVYGFSGMKEAQLIQTKATEEIKANVDTLQLDFQKAVSQYNLDYPKLSKAEREQRETLLAMQQENLQKYAQGAQQKIKEKDEEITQGVLNQVNSFVEEYGKKQGYDIVLGTTASGNILFATEGMDITSEVLAAINEHYQSTPKEVKE